MCLPSEPGKSTDQIEVLLVVFGGVPVGLRVPLCEMPAQSIPFSLDVCVIRLVRGEEGLLTFMLVKWLIL